MTKHQNQQNRTDHVCSLCERQIANGERYWRDAQADIVCFDCSPETFAATFRLMQDDGAQGPTGTRQVETVQDAKEQAVAWSMGQIGGPWDVLTVEILELDSAVEIRPGAEAIEVTLP